MFCLHVRRLVLIFLLSNYFALVKAQLQKTQVCVCLEEVASNLTRPLIIKNPNDDSGRLFVGEQRGIINIFFKNGAKRRSKPFLDISDLVLAQGEKGLLGLVFHPEFRWNQRFFIHYSSRMPPKNASYDHVGRISEFRVSRESRNTADKLSERLIMEIQQPYENHNGGEMIFDEDGYLLIFLGDGGSAGDPHGNAQNTSTILGKVLRIDVDTNRRGGYSIPRDNPFVKNPAFRSEIYAYGVRNMWRCGKDSGDPKTGRKKGRIMCGDVGQDKYEEIHLLKRGANFGWNAREGFKCFKNELCGKIGPENLPTFAYTHSFGKTVIGGEFYRGCLNPRLSGFYIFGDWSNGRLFRLQENYKENKWNGRELRVCNSKSCIPPLTSQYNTAITSFGLDQSGELYMVASIPSTNDSGKLYRFVDPIRNGDPSECKASKRFRRRQTEYRYRNAP